MARNAGLALLLAVPAAVPEAVLSQPGAAEALLTGLVLFVLLQTLNILWGVVPAWRPHRAPATGSEK